MTVDNSTIQETIRCTDLDYLDFDLSMKLLCPVAGRKVITYSVGGVWLQGTRYPVRVEMRFKENCAIVIVFDPLSRSANGYMLRIERYISFDFIRRSKIDLMREEIMKAVVSLATPEEDQQ